MKPVPIMEGDILDALYQIRIGFQKCDLLPPAAIILSSHDEGMRFLSAMNGAGLQLTFPHDAIKPVEHPDGSVWIEVTFADMKIRWPGNKYATQSGDYLWA